MTKKEVKKIWDRAKKGVSVSCDEYHSHSAERGCLSAKKDKRDIDICKLCEHIMGLYDRMERARKTLDKK
jgi:hypothetical protein